MLALCEVLPGFPAVPRLAIREELPELICDEVSVWPIQGAALAGAIRAAGGMLDAP